MAKNEAPNYNKSICEIDHSGPVPSNRCVDPVPPLTVPKELIEALAMTEKHPSDIAALPVPTRPDSMKPGYR